MRRTQPNAVTLILTGYPAFETALQAIRSQVDDYAVKPADVDELIALIREKLEDRKPHRPLPVKPLSSILRENQERLLRDWIAAVNAEPDLAEVAVDDEERSRLLSGVLLDVIQSLEHRPSPPGLDARATDALYGRERRIQGYSAPMLLKEVCLIRRVILSTAQDRLLSLDMSSVFADLISVDVCLDLHARCLLEAFLAIDEIAA